MSPGLPATALSAIHSAIVGLTPHPVHYERGLELQREAADRVRAGSDRGTLLLLEHPSVYTAGRRSDPADYPRDGTPVVPVDRGGKVTWHGPGQLVAYPIVRLRKRFGVVDFVRALERVLIETAADFGVRGFLVAGRAGVWADDAATSDTGSIGDTGATPSKFAQVGIHTRDGVVTHGIALNCSNDLAPFTNFVPCGITDAGVTTLSRLAGTTITPTDAVFSLERRMLAMLEEVAA